MHPILNSVLAGQVRKSAVDQHEETFRQIKHCLRQLQRSNGGQESVDLAKEILEDGLGADTAEFQKLTRKFLEIIDESKGTEYDVFVRKVDDVLDRACYALEGVGAVPNFGDRIREKIRALVVKHWAPVGEPQAKNQRGNTISVSNGCVRVIAKNAPFSLHRATAGKISDKQKDDIVEAVGFVDKCVCQLPKDKPMEHYRKIAKKLGVSVEMLNLFSLLNITAHAIAHQMRNGRPLPVVVASAESIKLFNCKGESTIVHCSLTFPCTDTSITRRSGRNVPR